MLEPSTPQTPARLVDSQLERRTHYDLSPRWYTKICLCLLMFTGACRRDRETSDHPDETHQPDDRTIPLCSAGQTHLAGGSMPSQTAGENLIGNRGATSSNEEPALQGTAVTQLADTAAQGAEGSDRGFFLRPCSQLPKESEPSNEDKYYEREEHVSQQSTWQGTVAAQDTATTELGVGSSTSNL